MSIVAGLGALSSLDHARIGTITGSSTSKPSPRLFTPRQAARLSYPVPPQDGGSIESKFGITLRDPWRSLEDLDLASTQKFIHEQNDLSVPYLQAHPDRPRLEEAVERIYSYPRTSSPELQGDGYYYWLFNPGRAPRDVLVRSNNLARDYGTKPESHGPEVVLDLNKEQGVSLYMYSFSPSGHYLCAILQESGSDWQTLRTIDTSTKQVVGCEMRQAKFTFGATWIGDSGYLYKRLIVMNAEQADGAFGFYYHRLDTPQSDDILIWRGTGPKATDQIVGRPHLMRGSTKGRSWLFFDIYESTSPDTECFVVELPAGLDGSDVGTRIAEAVVAERKWLSRGYNGETTYVGTRSDGTHIFLSKTDGVTSGRLLSYDISAWDSTSTERQIPTIELVPQHSDGLLLQQAKLVGDSLLVLVYLRDACAVVVFADANTGRPIGSADSQATRGHAHTTPSVEIPVPVLELQHEEDKTDHAAVIPKHAAITHLSCREDSDDFYLTVDTYVAPPYVLSGKMTRGTNGLDVKLGRLVPHEEGSQAREELVCRQVFYPSHDGVKIPLFINHRKDLDMSRPHPTLIYAYGGYGVSLVPTHNALYEAFMRELNGIVAIACIRGGGEYGKAWHEAALGIHRAVAFDDLAWAAKYLHSSGISTPSRTAVYGTSNGGLLVSACVNRHPELFAAALPDVGVHDLTRFHLFTLGRYWTAEFGNPDDASMFPYIRDYSPLQNVNPDPNVVYPAMLVTTGDHDTRVIPGHSLKYIAELQYMKPKNKGVFLGRIYINAGHESSSKKLVEKVEEGADRLVFLAAHLCAENNS